MLQGQAWRKTLLVKYIALEFTLATDKSRPTPPAGLGRVFTFFGGRNVLRQLLVSMLVGVVSGLGFTLQTRRALALAFHVAGKAFGIVANPVGQGPLLL